MYFNICHRKLQKIVHVNLTSRRNIISAMVGILGFKEFSHGIRAVQVKQEERCQRTQR